MSGYDMQNRAHQTTNIFFIHNCFGSFFGGILDWFAGEFYPRFNYKVIGTYDKAVAFFKKKKLSHIASTNLLPSITLDPMLDFSNDERAGKFLWQHARYAPAIGIRLWKSIDLKEQNILITPVFSRYQGTFEVTMWLSSVYELMDFRVALLQFCGGFNRWCRPETFWTYLTLPESVANYKKQDGDNIDWGNTLSDVMHVSTINKHKRVVPIELDPIWKLESFADASSKYGGDTIAEFKLSASFSYEINLPTYITVSENVDPSIDLSMSLGNTYTKYPLISPYKIVQAIKDNDFTNKYLDRNFNFYKIEDQEAEKDQLIIEFSNDSMVYPNRIEEWNYISSGTLLYVDDEFISDPLNKVKRDNIVVIDLYKKEYLPYIRRACAVISCQDTKSTIFYSKCEILKKPCICTITDNEKEIILEYVDKEVTLDSRQRKLYSGTLEVVDAENDDISSFRTIEDVKKYDPELYKKSLEDAKRKNSGNYNLALHRGEEHVDNMNRRLISDFTDGVQTHFPLGYILDSKSEKGLLLYINDEIVKQNEDYEIIDHSILKLNNIPDRGSTIYIGGELLVIKESKLVAVYEFTDEDINNIDTPICVTLPRPIDRQENIILISYSGKLSYGEDYQIDFESDTISVNIKPVVGELIQFFYYL